LLAELKRRQPPLAVVEHYVNRVDEKSMLSSWGVPSRAAENISFASDYLALELLPEMTSRSAETKFVITSHSRVGMPRAKKNAYREQPSVLKVVSFLNEKTTTEWLLKKLSRIYLGRVWKPEVAS
jgi:hypothetical protein